ncbi:Ig-like domain-containing protein [Zobellia uliginosa]|uniref:Ig-like domain-containing protein n=1 Tax=Zobellia uliginosa TaxID=143224 RepID=UPI0026E4213F|nr:Ig-like domain-containing protein [Zobellia uliginosa]MDO6516705.1 Ig-like domain-containing protein [Zobellia uliginosa]
MNTYVSYSNVLKALCLLLALFAQTSYSFNTPETASKVIHCNTVDCILNAMINASPGDEIVIAAGTYTALEKLDLSSDGKAARFSSDRNGTASQPIIIRGASASNRPVLKGPNGIYDGYVMRILGDHWIIKDLELEEGSKGLVLDHSSNSRIENVSVHDIGEEGIHLRDGSSNNLVTGCQVYNTGLNKPGFGEGLYVGSDKSQHKTEDQPNKPYSPDCNNNTIEFCTVGPNVAAEGVDVKEGTKNTIIRNNSFSAEGIAGEDSNSADAFIDLKGAYAFVYNNTFNLDGSELINACIDFLDRGTGYNTGFRNAVFNNTFNLGSRGNSINTVRKKQGAPSEIHVWNNTRNPNTDDFPVSDGTLAFVTQSCPSWNIVPCSDDGGHTSPSVSITSPNNNAQANAGSDLQISASANDPDGSISKVEFYNGSVKLGEDPSFPYNYTINQIAVGTYDLTAVAIDNENNSTRSSTVRLVVIDGDTDGPADCAFGTPSPNALPQYDGVTFNKVYVLGSGGPDASNIKKLKIKWIPSANGLYVFSMNTHNGQPSSYIDLRGKSNASFNSERPELSISGSGFPGLDGEYWVADDQGNFVMVSKSGSYTVYCSNEDQAPSCGAANQVQVSKSVNADPSIKLYPNPVTHGELTLANLNSDQTVISLMNLQGTMLKKEEVSIEGSTFKFNVGGIDQGIYFLRVENGSTVRTIPFSVK